MRENNNLGETDSESPIISADADWTKVFSDNSRPLFVEIGAGNGFQTLAMAKRRPDANFIAIEPQYLEFDNLAFFVQDDGLKNVKVVQGYDRDLLGKQKPGIVDLFICVAPHPSPAYFFADRRTQALGTNLLKPGGRVVLFPATGDNDFCIGLSRDVYGTIALNSAIPQFPELASVVYSVEDGWASNTAIIIEKPAAPAESKERSRSEMRGQSETLERLFILFQGKMPVHHIIGSHQHRVYNHVQ